MSAVIENLVCGLFTSADVLRSLTIQLSYSTARAPGTDSIGTRALFTAIHMRVSAIFKDAKRRHNGASRRVVGEAIMDDEVNTNGVSNA